MRPPRTLHVATQLSSVLLFTTAIGLCQEPARPPADPLLAQVAAKIAAGDLRGARALAEAASAAEPGSWRARVLQGYVLLALDQRVEAEARLQEALRNYDAAAKVRATEASGAPPVAGAVPAPEQPPAPGEAGAASVEDVAPAQLQHDDPERAARLLQKAFEAQPDRAELAFEAARLFRVARREWFAWVMYHRLGAHVDPRVKQRAADAQEGLGLGKPPQRDPGAPGSGKFDLGLAHQKVGNTKDAAVCFDKEVEANPGNAIAAMAAGGVFEQDHPPTESVRNWLRLLQKATGAARDKIAAHLKARGEELHRQGDELLGLGKVLEAIPFYEAAAETGTGQVSSHLQLARCYEQIGNFPKAGQYGRIVLALGDPDLALEANWMLERAKRNAARAEQLESTDRGAAAAAYAFGFAADPSLVRYGFRAAELFSAVNETAKVVELCRLLSNSPEYGEKARQMLAAIRQKAAERLAPKVKEAERLLVARDIAAAMQLLGGVFEEIDDPRFGTAKAYLDSGDLPQAEMVLRSALAALLDSGSETAAPVAGLGPIQEGADFVLSSGAKMSWVEWDATSGAEAVLGDPARRGGFWVSEESVSAPQVGRILRDDRNAPKHENEGFSWIQAEVFCAMLTDAERDAGRLSKEYAYRLPDLAMCKRAHAARDIPDNIYVWLSSSGVYYSTGDGTSRSVEPATYRHELDLRPVLVRVAPGGSL